MDAVITYDVSARQDDVKAKMLELGYNDRWVYNNSTFYLPNTTLWKANTELETSYNDINTVIQQLNASRGTKEFISLLRCMSFSKFPWYGTTGTPVR